MCKFLPVPASRYVMGLAYARKLIAKNTQKHLNLENPHWICPNILPENPEIRERKRSM